jgi:hypothetical protein
MMEYEAVTERQEAMRRGVARQRLALEARRARAPRRPLRLAVGTGLARLGLRLAGQTAVRAALGDAR